MNDFQKQAQIWRKNQFIGSGQMTLGQMIDACENLEVNNNDNRVVFDFCGQHPVDLDSWRGIYAELALNYGDGINDMTLEKFLKLLKDAVGETFTGYNGGDYIMTRDTPVWVANYGQSGNTAVVGITAPSSYQIVIHTAYREAY